MRHATYIGKDRRLKGATALVREDPTTNEGGNFGLLLAQFDCRLLLIDGNRLGFGWHLFDRSDFTLEGTNHA